MAQRVQLRQLLPKPATDTQQVFLPQVRVNDIMASWTSEPQSIVPKREAQENIKPVESETSKTRRSVAQQARRQRELAASIQQDIRIEAAERRLERAPDCDPTQALENVLDYNYDNWSRHRRESHRDRMQRMYGNCNYH
ncbi:hypothetical protein B0H12DRAFT_1123699 [Mycena haematopus]|nr:hypothetical protein B0H12DRAFT_1123699 [Mycena haematopus]